MKKILIITLGILLFGMKNLEAKLIPVSVSPSDQIIQGPCYLFATVAALESKALQAGHQNIDFYEWNIYSEDVLGSRTFGGLAMTEKLFEYAKNNGIYQNTGLFYPDEYADLPNENDQGTPGIASFTCNGNYNMINHYWIQDNEGTCTDDDGKKFLLSEINNPSYQYQFNDANGFYQDLTPTLSEMEAHLSNGRGLVVWFDDWEQNGLTIGQHAVFVYRKNANGTWCYKNSWPGAAGIECSDIYKYSNRIKSYLYLTGSFEPPLCEPIEGAAMLSGQETYTYNGCDNISWDIPSEFEVLSQTSHSITLKNSTCNTSPFSSTITATCNDPLSSQYECTVQKEIQLSQNAALSPTQISVLSPDWNNGTTCPNTVLELNAFDLNPAYPATEYEWAIQGATVLNASNSPSIFVQTPSHPSILNFKVRAKISSSNCSFSAWKTITGVSSSLSCSLGGSKNQFRVGYIPESHSVQLSIFGLEQSQYDLNYRIIDISGRVVAHGEIYEGDSAISLPNDSKGLLFVQLYDDENIFKVVEKVYVY